MQLHEDLFQCQRLRLPPARTDCSERRSARRIPAVEQQHFGLLFAATPQQSGQCGRHAGAGRQMHADITFLEAVERIVDGDITYTVATAAATSADANYNGINPSDVAVTNLNVDLAPGGNAPALIPATGTPALWALFLFMLTAGTVLLRRR